MENKETKKIMGKRIKISETEKDIQTEDLPFNMNRNMLMKVSGRK